MPYGKQFNTGYMHPVVSAIKGFDSPEKIFVVIDSSIIAEATVKFIGRSKDCHKYLIENIDEPFMMLSSARYIESMEVYLKQLNSN